MDNTPELTASDGMVEAAARELWRDFHARMGGRWEDQPKDGVARVQCLATARAMLNAALGALPPTIETRQILQLQLNEANAEVERWRAQRGPSDQAMGDIFNLCLATRWCFDIPVEVTPGGPEDYAAVADNVTRMVERVMERGMEFEAYATKATDVITKLTRGGSEYFGAKIGEVYTADLQRCADEVREVRMGLFQMVKDLKIRGESPDVMVLTNPATTGPVFHQGTHHASGAWTLEQVTAFYRDQTGEAQHVS